MPKNKPLMEVNNVQRKEFSYTLGHVTLKFTLRTDVKSELKAFRDLMERAAKDIDADLEALDKSHD